MEMGYTETADEVPERSNGFSLQGNGASNPRHGFESRPRLRFGGGHDIHLELVIRVHYHYLSRLCRWIASNSGRRLASGFAPTGDEENSNYRGPALEVGLLRPTNKFNL